MPETAADTARTGDRRRPPPVVLFDLDGTLIDSAPGIRRCLDETFAHFGIEPLTDESFRPLVGPPFPTTLPALVGDNDFEAVLTYYRTLYRAGGMFECTLYDGVEALLRGLRGAGVRLAVATSKLETLVEPILTRMGIDDCFEVRCGHEEPDRNTKTHVVAEALRRLGIAPATEISSRDVLMVGDRLHDVLGARANGVASLGAGWGYAAPGELLEAGATSVFGTPADLGAHWGLA